MVKLASVATAPLPAAEVSPPVIFVGALRLSTVPAEIPRLLATVVPSLLVTSARVTLPLVLPVPVALAVSTN